MAGSVRALNCLRKLNIGGLRSPARLLPRVFVIFDMLAGVLHVSFVAKCLFVVGFGCQWLSTSANSGFIYS